MKKVYQYSDEGIFLNSYNSQTEAANIFNIDEGTIRKAIKNNTLTKGYYWSNDMQSNYLDDIPKETLESAKSKILLLDIEVSATIAYTFPVYKAYIKPEQIIEDWYVLCWSAKWLNDSNIIEGNIGSDEDDFNIIAEIWNLLDEAEIVVTHNVKFDVNKLNTRFLLHGFTPPSPYKVFCTLKSARKNFGFTYNKLDYLAKQLGSDGKYHTDFKLWIDCMARDLKALKLMQEYCNKDVLELEKVYLKIRSWDNQHPTVSILNESPELACTKCGSSNIEYSKDTYTNTRVYKLYRCNDCNGWSRSRVSENKINVLISK